MKELSRVYHNPRLFTRQRGYVVASDVMQEEEAGRGEEAKGRGEGDGRGWRGGGKPKAFEVFRLGSARPSARPSVRPLQKMDLPRGPPPHPPPPKKK